MTIAVAIWQDGTSINELGGMSFDSGAEEEPMRLAAPLQCSVPGIPCARHDWMCADLN
jgi:hypothetical protein